MEGLQTVVDSQVSLSVVLAVDASGSMAGEPLTAAQTAAAEFVNGLSPQDSVAVLAFSDSVTVAQEPTADKASAISALQGLTAVGNTALFEATSRATAKALESSTPRRVIILLSDGVDYGGKSSVTRDDSITQARVAGVPLYTIGLGADIDRAYLSELAQATRRALPGSSHAGGTVAALRRYRRRLARSVRRHSEVARGPTGQLPSARAIRHRWRRHGRRFGNARDF